MLLFRRKPQKPKPYAKVKVYVAETPVHIQFMTSHDYALFGADVGAQRYELREYRGQDGSAIWFSPNDVTIIAEQEVGY